MPTRPCSAASRCCPPAHPAAPSASPPGRPAGPDSWSRTLEAEGIATKFVALDMSEAETVLGRLVEQLTALEAEGLEVDGVATFCEVAVPLVSRVAELMGLPGNSHAAVDAARNKHDTRRAAGGRQAAARACGARRGQRAAQGCRRA